MGACKCGTQMKLIKIKKDGWYRYYWRCPDCGRIDELAIRQSIKGSK